VAHDGGRRLMTASATEPERRVAGFVYELLEYSDVR
jgi:hypothetical protein